MKIAVDIFPTDQTIDPIELARAAEDARLRVALVPRALPHPDEPRVTVGRPRGRAAAARVLRPHLRPVRRPRRVRGGHLDDQAGHRHLPRRPTRPDPHGQGGRQRRRAVGRAVPLRHRLRLEQGGDGPARHGVRRASGDPARADPRHEGAVDRRRGLVRRRPRARSSRAGRGRSRRSSRTRRSSSAAPPARRPRRTSPSSATVGCRSVGASSRPAGTRSSGRATTSAATRQHRARRVQRAARRGQAHRARRARRDPGRADDAPGPTRRGARRARAPRTR